MSTVLVLPHNTKEQQINVEFTEMELESALKKASIGICHPYIHWPKFGYMEPTPGAFSVQLVPLSADDTPDSFIRAHARGDAKPLSAVQLVELVTRLNGELDSSKVFAFGEKCNVAGCDGYPYAHKQDGESKLGLWYFSREWPKDAVAAIGRPISG